MGGRAAVPVWRILAFVEALALGLAIAPVASGQEANSGIKLSWSHPATSTTKLMNRIFHGPFCHEDVTVTCDQLGKHDFLEITFNVLIMSSWDGSNMPQPDGSLEPVGPDYFRLGIQDGPTLLYHTFSNIPLTNPPGFNFYHTTSKAQSYPAPVPGVRLPPHAGASEFNSMGYEYMDVNPHPTLPMDATYRIHFIIPHNEPKAILEMNGLHLQDPFDENWGIANLVVRTLADAQVKRPPADSIGVAFHTCLDSSAPEGLINSFQTLVNGMDNTIDWIDKNIKPSPVDKRVQEMIVKLQSGKLDETRDAQARLRLMGALAEPYLRDARIGSDSSARLEIDTALETLGVTPIADVGIRRVILATRVLEVIGTPRAMSVRNNLTAAAP